MPDLDWQFLAALTGGGAMGAIITVVYNEVRNRIPRIGRRMDILPVFVPAESGADLTATVTLVHDQEITEYSNLYIGEMVVENRSRVDFPEFQFVVELLEGDRCVFVSKEDPDASHRLELRESVSPEKPAVLLKITLKPFNRRDRYEAKLYLVVPKGAKQPNVPIFSSRHAVRFMDMPTVRDVLAEASSNMKVGRMVVSLR